MEQNSQGGGDNVVLRSPEKQATVSNDQQTKRRSETFVMTGDKIIQKSSRVHSQRPVSSFTDDNAPFSGSSVNDVKRRSYNPQNEHRQSSVKKRRSYAAGDSKHASVTDNRQRSDNTVISGAISTSVGNSAAVAASKQSQTRDNMDNMDIAYVVSGVPVDVNQPSDVKVHSNISASVDANKNTNNDVLSVESEGVVPVRNVANETVPNVAESDDTVPNAVEKDDSVSDNQASFDDSYLPDPPDMLLVSAVVQTDSSLDTSAADNVSILRTPGLSKRSVSEVRQSEFYRSLDIPPDDISLEDERYKSVLVDLDSLPPPPDDFFEESFLPAPTKHTAKHSSPLATKTSDIQHNSLLRNSSPTGSAEPCDDSAVTAPHAESYVPMSTENFGLLDKSKDKSNQVDDTEDFASSQIQHTTDLPVNTFVQATVPSTIPESQLARDSTDKQPHTTTDTDKQLHTTSDTDKQLHTTTDNGEHTSSANIVTCDKLDMHDVTDVDADNHQPAPTHVIVSTSTENRDTSPIPSSSADDIGLGVGKKARRSSKKKKGTKLKKSLSAENVLLEVTVQPAVLNVDDLATPSPLIPLSSAISLPDSSARVQSLTGTNAASAEATDVRKSPKKRIVDNVVVTHEAETSIVEKTTVVKDQAAEAQPSKVEKRDKVRSKTVSSSPDRRPSSTSPASTSPDHSVSSQASSKPPKSHYKDSASTSNLVTSRHGSGDSEQVTSRQVTELSRRSSVGTKLQQADKRRVEQTSMAGDAGDTPGQYESDRRSKVRSAISQPNLSPQKVPSNQPESLPTKRIDRNAARLMAQKLFSLDGFTRTEVSAYLSKTDAFVQLVGEEFIKLYSFAGTPIESALRDFLHTLPLIGETQERERVLSHFSRRYIDCNPNTFKSFDACHTITCAMLLLNTDLHGQNIGKKMTVDKFIKNLDGLNDGRNFDRADLTRIYKSIRSEPLPLPRGETPAPVSAAPTKHADQQFDISNVNSNYNPMLDVPDPEKCVQYKCGYIRRKSCVQPNGEPTAKGRRSWKLSYGRLCDLMLYLLKDETELSSTNAVANAANALRVHHALATPADDYAKKQSVFRLITADGAMCLIQASNDRECHEWISAINYVAAALSSPPLPSGVGSQRRFQRPLMPSSKTKHNLCEQLYHHEQRVKQTNTDLGLHRAQPPPANSSKVTVQEFKDKEQYLTLELQRFQTYCDVLRRQLSRTAVQQASGVRLSGTPHAEVNGSASKTDSSAIAAASGAVTAATAPTRGAVTAATAPTRGAVTAATAPTSGAVTAAASSESNRRPSQTNVKDTAVQRSLSDRSRALVTDDRTTAKLYERTVASFGTPV